MLLLYGGGLFGRWHAVLRLFSLSGAAVQHQFLYFSLARMRKMVKKIFFSSALL